MLHLIGDALRRNPYPLYRFMRFASPVLRPPGRDLWMVFDHANVKRAIEDRESFSSRAAPPGDSPLEWMIFLDPPRHTKLRAIVTRTFTPRAIATLEPTVRALSTELLDRVIDRGTMDLVSEYATPLPLAVISAMLGLPPGAEPQLERWTDAILGLGEAIHGGERAARAARLYADARAEMEPYLAVLLDERRTAPKDDLLTRLLQAEVDGEHLSDQEMLDFFLLLLVAGVETTTNLISNAMLCLLAHPDQLSLVRARPDLIPSAIEEVLRYRSPLQMVFRATTRDIVMGRHRIPAGKLVLAMIGSANRDEARIPNAGRFDITRAMDAHLAFGHGIHFCLGAALARLEGRVAIGDLVTRLRNPRLAEGRRWEPRNGINVHGPRRLALRFEADSGVSRPRGST